MNNNTSVLENGNSRLQMNNDNSVLKSGNSNLQMNNYNSELKSNSLALNIDKLVLKLNDKNTIGVNNPESTGAEEGQIYFKIIN